MADYRDEYELPKAVMDRVAKSALPANVHVAKDAKAAFSKSAKAFILYLTGLANIQCESNSRTSILSDDVFRALDELDLLQDFEADLKACLNDYQEKVSVKKKKVEQGKKRKAKSLEEASNGNEMRKQTPSSPVEPVSKKARVEGDSASVVIEFAGDGADAED